MLEVCPFHLNVPQSLLSLLCLSLCLLTPSLAAPAPEPAPAPFTPEFAWGALFGAYKFALIGQLLSGMNRGAAGQARAGRAAVAVAPRAPAHHAPRPQPQFSY